MRCGCASPALYALASTVLLVTRFGVPAGALQFALVALGLLAGAGFAEPSGAVVADVTHRAITATGFATLTLANNLLGLAPGPFVTGLIADAAGLDAAMRVIPLAGLGAAVLYWQASRHYEQDRRHHATP